MREAAVGAITSVALSLFYIVSCFLTSHFFNPFQLYVTINISNLCSRQQVASAREVDLASPSFDCCWMLAPRPAATS